MSDSLFADPKFKKHAAGVISTVDAAVGMLDKDLEPLIGILKKLGRKHKVYGVLPPHYDVVGQALVETLAAAMGLAFTEEVKNAWIQVYGIISSTMMEGAVYGETSSEKVIESWKLVTAIDNYEEIAGEILFRK